MAADMPVQDDAAPLSCCTGTAVIEQLAGLDSWARNEACVLGIDEAGRGPVLGPMVYAAAYAPVSADLTTRSFADSKTLTAQSREALFDRIRAEADIGFAAELLSAHFISTRMLARSRSSLNALAADSTHRLIQRVLDAGVNVTQVFVDTVGDADRYAAKLSSQFPTLSFTVCPKADSLYPCVSAASIVAKVTRDRALTATARACGVPADAALGTGYPADPDTKKWLQAAVHRVWGFAHPHLVRFSWETCSRVMADSGCVAMGWEADEEGAGGGDAGASASASAQQQQQRLAFCKRPADVVETSGAGRHGFFRARKLQRLKCSF